MESSTALTRVVFNKTAGGLVYIGNQNLNIGNFSIPASQNFSFVVRNTDTLTLPNGATISSGTFQVDGGATVKVSSGQTFTVSGGTVYVNGVNDTYPQSTGNKGRFCINGSGSWGFNATSGTLNLTGFLFDDLDVNGLRVNGTTNLTNFNGGQFRTMNSSYASLRALQISTTGTLPSVAANVGWNFGPGTTVPAFSQAYLIGYSSGCAGRTITFDPWFGDFYSSNDTPENKINTTSCSFILGATASAVTLAKFSATGYSDAVSVDWETSSETDHRGFNVYRSLNPLFGFVRVNSELIRNDLESTTGKGKYRYLDSEVESGQVYYYMLEDVAFNNSTTLHGPVSALAGSLPGSAPGTSPGVNQGDSQPDATGGSAPDIANSGLKDLGNGVKILAQTSHTFRIEITPAAAVYSTSGWDGTYQQVRIPGYSSTLEAGKPEVPDRVILVEVDGSYGEASVLSASVTEAATSTHRLQPAPSYAADSGGTLVASYSPDATAYASATVTPSAYHQVATALVEVAGKRYVSLRVNPLKYQASTQTVHRADRIVLDIALGGSAWVVATPATAYHVSPSAVEGALRVRYGETGVYELTYDQMAEVGVEGPFAGRSVDTFRLYAKGVEIPMEVIGGSTFGPGSALRFSAIHSRLVEDDLNEVVLTPFSLGSSTDPLRMAELDADPAGYPDSVMAMTPREFKAEQDNIYIFDVPFGSLVDRFYWKRVYALHGTSGLATALYTIPLQLPGLVSEDGTNVRVDLDLRGRKTLAFDSPHHMGLWLNALPSRVGEATFSGDGPTSLSFDLPSTDFVDGTNSIKIEAISDLTNVDDYQIIDLDRVKVTYQTILKAEDGIASLTSPYLNGGITVTNFSPSATVNLYDISVSNATTKLTGLVTQSLDGNLTTQTTFALHRGTIPSGLGEKLLAVEEGAFRKPAALALVDGYGVSLRDSSRGADMILIGPDTLLDEAKALSDYRQSQGLRVARVTAQQIYAEFSHGSKSSQAIRDFVRYTHAHWIAPAPRYVLFLGDASYDPRDRLDYGNASVMPMPVLKGTYEDFGGDHWFVADDSDVALMSVGRIPTRDPNLLRTYTEKLIAYENGTRAPEANGAHRAVFISDTDVKREQFKEKAELLGESFVNEFPEYTPTYLDRKTINNDVAMRSSLVTAFGSSPILISFVGHGAEDVWGNGSLFTSAHASALVNTRLPLVMGLNCLNAAFYDVDPELKSMGESLVLNPSGGAAAFVGFTTMTVPAAQVGLQTALQNELASEIGKSGAELRLGDLMLRAKASVGISEQSRDAIRSFSLIGDPAMKMPRALFQASEEAPSAETPAVTQAEEGGGGCLRARGPSRPAQKIEFALIALLFAVPLLAGRRFVKRHARSTDK